MPKLQKGKLQYSPQLSGFYPSYRFQDLTGNIEEIFSDNPIAIMGLWMTTLQVLYTFILGREPDREGLVFWANALRLRAPKNASALRKGQALVWVLTKFITNSKFKAETG